MTTETLIQLFTGIAIIGVISSLLNDGEDDDHGGPDKGIMSPVMEGT
jgi:hypothetical protein